MYAAPICKDCQFLVIYGKTVKGHSFFCSKSRDYVYGDYEDCASVRGDEGKCGKGGNWFVERGADSTATFQYNPPVRG